MTPNSALALISLGMSIGILLEKWCRYPWWMGLVPILPAAISVIISRRKVSAAEARLRLAKDRSVYCQHCNGIRPHRFRPSPDAGRFWRCSECGEAQ